MESKGVNTKATIIAKSAELFNVYGYHGTSLSQIMEATQLKKGGIYNHFKNKDEIAVAAFDFAFAKVLNRFRSQLQPLTTSATKIEALCVVFREFVTDPVIPGGCPIVNTAIDATDSHPQLKARAKEAVKTLENYIRIKIEEGIKNGEFSPKSSADEAALHILTVLEGAIMLSRVNSELKYLNDAQKHIRKYMSTELIRTK